MKNILLVSNIILLGLVGYLYYVHFQSPKKASTQTSQSVQQSSSASSGNKVAYIDLDSLQNNYEYYKVLKSDFERKQSASNGEITSLQKRYAARAQELQQKGPTMNQQEQENAMKEINQMQQSLQEKKQQLDNELYNSNSKMKEDILLKIQTFLKEYNKDGRYSYIFSYEPGFIFYKDTTLNITQDVIEGLNAQYKKDKK